MSQNDEEMKDAFTTPNVNLGKKPLFKPPFGSGSKGGALSKPAPAFSSEKKPAGLFMKPKMISKKKFQMDVAPPTESDLQQIQKVEQKLLSGPKITNNPLVKKGPMMSLNKTPATNGASALGVPSAAAADRAANSSNFPAGARSNVISSANQASGASLTEAKVNQNFLRPMALQEKTKIVLAQQRANPRPPSQSGKAQRNMQSILAKDSDGYSDEAYDDNDFEEENKDDDAKLENLRKALARENQKAVKVVTKANI